MANEIVIDVNANTEKAKGKLQSFSKSARTAGIALTAMGAAGTVAIKGFVDAAMEQERALATLGNAVNNLGIPFDSVKGKIEATTAALQAKTNFGDEEQMRALQLMIPTLGSVDKALAALPAIMDAATTKGISLGTVAGTLTRALDGQVNTAISLGMSFEEGTSFAERLEQVLGAVGGAAEANVDPFTQLSNNMGDLKEKIGSALLPALIPIVEFISSMVVKLQEMNPTVLKTIVVIGGIATAFAVVAGPILILLSMIPAIVAGFGMITAAATVLMGATGIGLIVIGIAALALAWKTNFGGIQEKTQFVFDKLKELFNILKTAFFDKFQTQINTIGDVWFNLMNGLQSGWETVKGFLINSLKSLVEFFLKGFQVMIDAVNKIPGVSIPSVTDLMENIADMGGAAAEAAQKFIRLGTEVNKLNEGTGMHQLDINDSRVGGGGVQLDFGRRVSFGKDFSQEELGLAGGVLGRMGLSAEMVSRMTDHEKVSAARALEDFEKGPGQIIYMDGMAASVDSTEGAEAVNASALGSESGF
jgi:hypothetical protein